MFFRDWSIFCITVGYLQLAGAAVFRVKKDLVVPDHQARTYDCAYNTVNIFGQSIRSTTAIVELSTCPTSRTETITQTIIATAAAPSQSLYTTDEDAIIPAKVAGSADIPEDPDQYTSADLLSIIDPIVDVAMAPDGPNANYSRYPCPSSLANNYQLKSDGSSWQLFCNTDLYYHDLRAHNATNLAVCMQECVKLNSLVAANPKAYGTQYCVAVTYTTWAAGLNANCYLKHAVTTAIYQAYKFDSAKLASFQLPNALAVSVYSNRATPALPAPATSVPPGPYEAASPCPYPNRSYYKYANRTNPRISNVYQVYCDTSYYYNDLPGVYTNSFDDCVAACDQWIPIFNPNYDISVHQPCIAITYRQYVNKNNATVTPNCHLKYAIQSTATGVRPVVIAATRVDSSVPASLVITSTYSPKPTS